MTKLISLALLFIMIAGCRKNELPQSNPFVSNDQHTNVATQHNNNMRTGLNSSEMKLTTANVNAQQFGKLFTLKVDDQVFAQPLIAGNMAVNSVKHNVAIIATVNNTVYAYDADNGNLFWKKSYTAPGMRPPRNTDMTGACGGNY